MRFLQRLSFYIWAVYGWMDGWKWNAFEGKVKMNVGYHRFCACVIKAHWRFYPKQIVVQYGLEKFGWRNSSALVFCSPLFQYICIVCCTQVCSIEFFRFVLGSHVAILVSLVPVQCKRSVVMPTSCSIHFSLVFFFWWSRYVVIAFECIVTECVNFPLISRPNYC